ncbi:MAG TPA: carboxypeptidase regulatory-like domain-containing protein, partial [Terriglobales bacterium]
GAVVPNASVTITNTDRNAVIRTVKTGDAGQFAAPLLPVGHYALTVDAPGFQKYEQAGITVNLGDHLTFFPTLNVGSSSQTVSVEANATQVNLQSVEASGLVSGTQVRELALNGRNWEQLVTLVPGVSDAGNADTLYVGAFAPQGTNLVTFSINGGRREENNYMIDGFDNIDRGSGLTLLSFPSVDAISQFSVIRSQYAPEYGRAASGQVNVITKSGTSSLHGSLYEFLRNDTFNANNYFAKQSQLVKGLPNRAPLLRYNDFGGTIGGPVWIPKIYEQKNKTFFFFSEEARRNLTFSNPVGTVPTTGMLTGQFLHPVCTAFDASNSCTATGTSISTIDPVAQAYIKDIFSKYPQPNNPAVNPFSVVSSVRGIFNFHEEIYKIDHTVNSKLSLSGKILRDTIPTRESGGLFTNIPIDDIGSTNTNSPGHNYTVRATLTLSPTFLIEPAYGYSYGAILSVPDNLLSTKNSPDIASAITLPFSTVLGRVPNLTLTTGGTGPQTFGPYNDYNINHNALVNVTKVKGNHTIKFGATYYHYEKHENAGSGNQGVYAMNNNGVPAGTLDFEQAWANFLLGRVGTFTQSSLDLTADILDNQFEYYAQDSWRVKPNLTLTYGFRHSFFRQPYSGNGIMQNFYPAAYDPAKAPCITSTGTIDVTKSPTGTLTSACNPNYDPLNGYIFAPGQAPAGVTGHVSPWGNKMGPEYNRAIAPRLGVAWDPFGKGTTSIRAGFGMFYDSGNIFGNAENDVFTGIGYQNNVSFTNVTFQDPTGGAPIPSTGITPNITQLQSRIDTNYKSPYTQQWSLDVQHMLPSGWLFDVGYYGQNGIHLPGFFDNNQTPENSYLQCTDATPCMSGPNVISFTQHPSTGPAFVGVTSANTNLLNALRPFIGYSGGNAVRGIYTENYNALQTQVQKQFSGNTTINISYTWSHALTTYVADRSTGSIMPVQGHLRDNNYGPGIGDRRHVLTANFVWEIPWLKNQPGFLGHVLGGWEFSGIQTFQTGLPGNVTQAVFDPTGAGCLGPSPCSLRPNQVSDPNSGAPHTFEHWFSQSAFATPSVGQTTIPTARPGAVRLPGFWRSDLGLFKNFKIGEQLTFQFRGEAFNAFNHTNPICCASLTSTNTSSFGVITSARDPRTLELGAKLLF